MATTTGIYWCLILTGCISLAVSASLVQTVPPNSTHVCPGDRLVLTCTTDNPGIDSLLWRGDSGTERAIKKKGNPITVDSYNIIAASVDGVTVSTATNESVPVQLNGTMIGCSDDIGNTFTTIIINVTDIPEAVTNITIDLINNNGLLIIWDTPSDPCTDHYNVTINSNNTLNESRTTNNTNITINDLIIGTNYSFIIIPIDTIGREGPPSSLIQYIWNVPAQVVNISWDQISTDTITIWWNNTEDYSTIPVPPIQYYIITVYNTSNSIIYTNNTNDTNITITGLPLTDTNYTVTIIPVNVIGYGPSATVNGINS
uniref:Fibronectin type-III domain-containing protein n=1 Tax=Amphimedon queenslandica TaxID=400682 RepID=A0A1X7TI45_AMPQE